MFQKSRIRIIRPILEMFHSEEIHDVGASTDRRKPTLISREIIFQEFQLMWSQSTNVTDGQTDRRHALQSQQDRALH